jgi:hypothetical protein
MTVCSVTASNLDALKDSYKVNYTLLSVVFIQLTQGFLNILGKLMHMHNIRVELNIIPMPPCGRGIFKHF